MKNHTVSRREAIKGVGGLLLATSLSLVGVHRTFAGGETQESGTILWGKVVIKSSPTSLTIHTINDQDIEILVNSNTLISRGDSGQGVSIEKFVPNDEVVAIGKFQNSALVATELQTMYRFLEGSIIERHGNKVETTGGTAHLTPRTIVLNRDGFVNKSLHEITSGDNIMANCWNSPSGFKVASIGILDTVE